MEINRIKTAVAVLNRAFTAIALGILCFYVRYGPNSTVLYDSQIYNSDLEQCKGFLKTERFLHESSRHFFEATIIFTVCVVLLCQLNLYLFKKIESTHK